jgi:hypothetical protein
VRRSLLRSAADVGEQKRLDGQRCDPSGVGPTNDNPFRQPIVSFVEALRGIEWSFPYLPGIVSSAVLLLVLMLVAGLYATVGIASQITGLFHRLVDDARRQRRRGTSVEKSAYIVAIAGYLVLLLPFWLVQLPFQLLGAICDRPTVAVLFVTAVPAAPPGVVPTPPRRAGRRLVVDPALSVALGAVSGVPPSGRVAVVRLRIDPRSAAHGASASVLDSHRSPSRARTAHRQTRRHANDPS